MCSDVMIRAAQLRLAVGKRLKCLALTEALCRDALATEAAAVMPCRTVPGGGREETQRKVKIADATNHGSTPQF